MRRLIVATLLAFTLMCAPAISSPLLGNPTPVVQKGGKPDVKVWVNTDSGVYHCPGTRWYGKTKQGEYMTQKQAQDKGYRPAYGRVCEYPHPTTGASTGSPRTSFGFDRRSVKTLTDRDKGRVKFNPVDTTIAMLAAIRIHQTPYPKDSRIEPEELNVYRLRARLLEVRNEKDKDLHLILADLDNPEVRMIAEIPAPECVKGSAHEDEFRQAREAVSAISRNTVVEVIGVGFFDFLHDAKGGAKNGMELHPVLRISVMK